MSQNASTSTNISEMSGYHGYVNKKMERWKNNESLIDSFSQNKVKAK